MEKARRRPRNWSRLRHVVLSFAAALAIAAIGAMGFARFAERARLAAAPPAPRSEWIEHGRPVQMFALQTAEFGKDVRIYEARRHREGGGRQDFLTYGAAELTFGPSLRVSIYRPGVELPPDAPFAAELASLAARSGLSIGKSGGPTPMATRFGAYETADVALVEGAAQAPCLGFRLRANTPALHVSGLACEGSRPIDRTTLACALDRLDLIVAGEDRELAKFFILAEQGRGRACAARGAPGARATWLDQNAAPPLRNSNGGERIVSR